MPATHRIASTVGLAGGLLWSVLLPRHLGMSPLVVNRRLPASPGGLGVALGATILGGPSSELAPLVNMLGFSCRPWSGLLVPLVGFLAGPCWAALPAPQHKEKHATDLSAGLHRAMGG